MKIRKIAALVLVAAFLLTGVALADTVKATSGDTWLRSGPGLSYSQITVMHRGESAQYLNSTRYDSRGVAWYNVSFSGRSGWVSSRYTTLSSGGSTSWDDDTLWVRATARVNVRSGPGTGYDDIGTLVRGECISYLGVSQTDSRGVTWYKAQYYSYGTGWVSSTYSELVYTRTSAEGDWVDTSGSYIRATGRLNVRSGPGLSYADKGTILSGNTAPYLGEYSVDERGVTWYKVSYNGGSGWVSSRYCELY